MYDVSEDSSETRQRLFARIAAAREHYARTLDLSPTCSDADRQEQVREAKAALASALAELEPLRNG